MSTATVRAPDGKGEMEIFEAREEPQALHLKKAERPFEAMERVNDEKKANLGDFYLNLGEREQLSESQVDELRKVLVDDTSTTLVDQLDAGQAWVLMRQFMNDMAKEYANNDIMVVETMHPINRFALQVEMAVILHHRYYIYPSMGHIIPAITYIANAYTYLGVPRNATVLTLLTWYSINRLVDFTQLTGWPSVLDAENAAKESHAPTRESIEARLEECRAEVRELLQNLWRFTCAHIDMLYRYQLVNHAGEFHVIQHLNNSGDALACSLVDASETNDIYSVEKREKAIPDLGEKAGDVFDLPEMKARENSKKAQQKIEEARMEKRRAAKSLSVAERVKAMSVSFREDDDVRFSESEESEESEEEEKDLQEDDLPESAALLDESLNKPCSLCADAAFFGSDFTK